MSEDRDNAGVVAPPPLIYGGSLILGLLLSRLFPAPFLSKKAAHALGWPLVVGGVLLAGSFFRSMRRAGTPPSPYEPVASLVTSGPFRYSRNPIYLAFTMIYAGISCLTNALWAALLLPPVLLVMRRGVIQREERYLERRFGTEYLRYKARVRRWL